MKNESEEIDMVKKTIVTLALISFIGQGCADTAISADTARIQDLAALQEKLDKLEKVLTKLQTQSNGHARLLTDVSDSLTQVAAVVANHNSALKDPDKLRKRAWDSNGKALGHLLMKKQGNVVTIDHPEYGPIDLDLDDENTVTPLDSEYTLWYEDYGCVGSPYIRLSTVFEQQRIVSHGDTLISNGNLYQVQEGSTFHKQTKSFYTYLTGCQDLQTTENAYWSLLIDSGKSLVFSGPITLD